MAKHNITIEDGNDWKVVGNSMSTFYRFHNNKLLIYWSREVYQHEGFKIGDDIIVDCWGGVPEVYKFQYPKNPYKLLRMAWGYVDSIVFSKEEAIEEITDVNNDFKLSVLSSYDVAGNQLTTVGLFDRGIEISDEFRYFELYQAGGTEYKLIYINPNMSLKRFREELSTVLGIDAVSRVPDTEKINIGSYLKRYGRYE